MAAEFTLETMKIALGGGTVIDNNNVRYLKTIGKIVYLYCSPELLKQRAEKNAPAFIKDNFNFERGLSNAEYDIDKLRSFITRINIEKQRKSKSLTSKELETLNRQPTKMDISPRFSLDRISYD